MSDELRPAGSAGPAFTCDRCGEPFTLPQHVLDRYPGWTPRRCRPCRDRSGGAERGSGPERGSGRRAGSAPAGGGGRRRRPAPGPVEEHRTVAEVLDRYDGGPADGVFTDGSASPNPGPGGWGAVYVAGGEVLDRAWGHDPDTTNNRMELTALLAGIDLVPEGTPATIYTDSRLVYDTATKWAAGWQQRGWRRKAGPIANLDLVKRLHERLTARPELRLQWIAAHAGNRWNEYADALSTAYLRDEV